MSSVMVVISWLAGSLAGTNIFRRQLARPDVDVLMVAKVLFQS